MIKSNYHTHTLYADGKNSAEEMILAAIDAGFTEIGFSEHAYTAFDRDYSMTKESTYKYISEISALKTRYSDKIAVFCGTEADYYSEFDCSLYDYVIGSVHYLYGNNRYYPLDSSPTDTKRCIDELFGGDSDAYAEAYYEKVSEIALRTNASIIGHFDLITKFNECSVLVDTSSVRYKSAWHKALETLKGSVFEINTGAISRGWRTSPYPETDILNAMFESGSGIVISSDSHSASSIACGFTEAEALARNAKYVHAGFTDANGIKHSQF